MSETPKAYRYTCKKDQIDHRDYVLCLYPKMEPAGPVGTGAPVDPLKATSRIDLRATCPAVYNQGDLGSCVSNGTAFNIQFDQIKGQLPHQFMPSRLFIYYNSRVIEGTVGEDSGSSVRDAMITVNRQGAPPETLWPYNIGQFATQPTSEVYDNGLKHLVTGYSRVVFSLAQMKQSIIDGYPFIFGILVYPSFENIGSDGMCPVPGARERVLGGHCMACVGYDDALQRFIVRNSWGDSWGDHGYCYIPYSYMTDPNQTFDLWTIRTLADTETPDPVPVPVPVNNIQTIQRVTYGKGTRVADVTTIFINYFNAGKTSLKVNNSLFGDPYRGVVKQLQITFKNGATRTFAEHATIQLSDIVAPAAAIIKATNITKAMYGKNKTYRDVTTIVRNQFSQGYPQLPVSNALFTDPLPRVVKELRITLSNGTVKIYREGSIVYITDIVI